MDDPGRSPGSEARDALERLLLDGPRRYTRLQVAELSGMTALAGPGRAVLEPTADWQIFERQRSLHGQVNDWHTLEGPVVRHHQGRYYLLYSGGSYLGEGYGVAWARADHPLGPWTEPERGAGERLLASVPGHVRGPGHNSVVTTPSGQDVLVYHAWDAAGTARRMSLDPLLWTADGPRLLGPTYQPTTLPRWS